ncbi:MAG: hypothetical protein SV760_01770, partial [Halobacteria archaeon]|nr:hypothetical protein [Halobacteria archaeon]
MDLDLSKQAKIQMGIVLVVGLVIGTAVGTFVGSTVLTGYSDGDELREKCDPGEGCVEIENHAGYNVKVHFYDDGDKIETSESIPWSKVKGIKNVGNADTIKIESDVAGPCGEVFETFSNLERSDYPIEIAVDHGGVCFNKD